MTLGPKFQDGSRRPPIGSFQDSLLKQLNKLVDEIDDCAIDSSPSAAKKRVAHLNHVAKIELRALEEATMNFRAARPGIEQAERESVADAGSIIQKAEDAFR